MFLPGAAGAGVGWLPLPVASGPVQGGPFLAKCAEARYDRVRMASKPKGPSYPGSRGRVASDLPPPPAPTGAPTNQPTVMLEARPQAVARDMVTTLPPVRAAVKQVAWGRWVLGPGIAIGVAFATAQLAGVLFPVTASGHTVTHIGRLRLNSEPPGAQVRIDGKRLPGVTPTVVEGEVGFDAACALHARRVRIQRGRGLHRRRGAPVCRQARSAGAAAVRAADSGFRPEPVPDPHPAVRPAEGDRHHHHSAVKEPIGLGTLSVFVRPWAIVYVDGTRLRQTPVQNFELPAGPHILELVNDGKNRREKISLQLRPGVLQEIRRDWDK